MQLVESKINDKEKLKVSLKEYLESKSNPYKMDQRINEVLFSLDYYVEAVYNELNERELKLYLIVMHDNISYRTLAEYFGVSKSTIGRIIDKIEDKIGLVCEIY